MIATRSTPRARACSTPHATLLRYVEAIARSGSAWCPAGRAWTSARWTPPSRTASTAASTPPTVSRAASQVAGVTGAYSPSHGPPAQAARRRSRYAAVWTASSASSGAGTGAMRASALPSALRSTRSCACAVSTAWATFALPNVKSRPAICTVAGRRIVGEDPRRVRVAQHDATILTIPVLGAVRDERLRRAPDAQPRRGRGPLLPAV